MSNQIAQRETECQQYLNDSTGVNADQFSLEEFCDQHSLSPEVAETFICNLEDHLVMSQLCEGDYSTFDESDRDQFNDGYSCIISNMIKSR